MKFLIALMLAAAAVAGQGCIVTAASSWMTDSAPTAPPGATEAKIIVYRPPVYWANTAEWEIWDDERFMGVAENGGYFEYRCPPGRRLLTLHSSTPSAVEAEIEAGRTYFVEIDVRSALIAYPVMVPRGRTSEEERRILGEGFGRCGAREVRREKASEEALARGRQEARRMIALFKKERAKECSKLSAGDGY